MRLGRPGAAAASLLALLSLAAASGAASPSPLPSNTPSASPAPDAHQALVDEVRLRVGASLAAALAVQLQLAEALRQNAQQQQQLSGQLQATAAEVARLDADIAARQRQIERTQARIAAERAEMAALARAVYAQPSNLFERLVQAHSLRDALVGTADLAAAGQRAQELKAALSRDLDTLQAAQQAQTADRERQARLLADQQRGLDTLKRLRAQEDETGGALASAIERAQAELRDVDGQQSDLALRIAAELEAEQAQIAAAAEQEAWTQAAMWIQANPVGQTPVSAGHSTRSRFIWPLPQAAISQGFGPSGLAFEPPYAGFAHFHTGLDLVEPAGSLVLAADDGVVAASESGTAGYGNYVVIAHTGGITTLYGHLAASVVHAG